MSNCTKCGQSLKEGTKFCGQCGAAVRYCPKCGQQLKEGAAFCGQCGAAVNQVAPDYGAGVPPPAPVPYPVAPQAPATSGYVRLTLGEIGFFFGQIAMTVLVDGNAVRTIQMNETVEFAAPVGMHTIELVQVYHSAATLNMPITRKSDLQVNIVPGTLTVITGSYWSLTGKFSLDLQ